MKYQRLHIRVPASGNAILLKKGDVKVEASVINVSVGGFCITAPSHLLDQHEYQVQVITPSHGKIHFSGIPVYQSFESIGIKITSIEKEQLQIIYQMVGSFQLTDDFIKYIDERDIIHDWLVDESGEDIAITFEADPEKSK
ncbi:MAG: PilZ domain-containing protein [Desulfobulbia bacterium]